MQQNETVLDQEILDQLEQIQPVFETQDRSLAHSVVTRRPRQGYPVVFYGPTGTGKTLAANLLGKRFSKEVMTVDAGRIVSKYIGETEKNLRAVFKEAASKDAILYFDEADALFGKRSAIRDAHDKYANIEVNYLLQLIEEYPGIVIISASSKQAIDEAFMRRLHSIVRFPYPTSG